MKRIPFPWSFLPVSIDEVLLGLGTDLPIGTFNPTSMMNMTGRCWLFGNEKDEGRRGLQRQNRDLSYSLIADLVLRRLRCLLKFPTQIEEAGICHHAIVRLVVCWNWWLLLIFRTLTVSSSQLMISGLEMLFSSDEGADSIFCVV